LSGKDHMRELVRQPILVAAAAEVPMSKRLLGTLLVLGVAGCVAQTQDVRRPAANASIADIRQSGRDLVLVLRPGLALDQAMGFHAWKEIMDGPALPELKVKFGSRPRTWTDSEGEIWSEFDTEDGVIQAGTETSVSLTDRSKLWRVYFVPKSNSVTSVFSGDVAAYIDVNQQFLTVVLEAAAHDAAAVCEVWKGAVSRCLVVGTHSPPPA
jgi:hypothetical protein